MPANPFTRLINLFSNAFTDHSAGHMWIKVCFGILLTVSIWYSVLFACNKNSLTVQDDLLDTLHWLRQANAVLLGLMWGCMGVTGFIGFLA